MYTRVMFGRQLKKKVLERENIEKIGSWAHSVYFEYIRYIDLDFRDVLLTLNAMELGPEFAYTYEELDKIADDLIAGRDVKL